MWDSDYKDEFTAMQYALERQHNDTERIFQFKLFADNIKTVDAYKLTRIICRQVSVQALGPLHHTDLYTHPYPTHTHTLSHQIRP